jgi:hypothetical protein
VTNDDGIDSAGLWALAAAPVPSAWTSWWRRRTGTAAGGATTTVTCLGPDLAGHVSHPSPPGSTPGGRGACNPNRTPSIRMTKHTAAAPSDVNSP